MHQNFFNIDPRVEEISDDALKSCRPYFERIEDICTHNTKKVLSAFMNNHVSESHLIGTTGYGYGDRGRDTLDAVYAEVFGAEDALVRHTFVSGTNAIASALFGVLRPNDTMVCLTGLPYDTLHSVLGLNQKEDVGSLKDFGIHYKQLELLDNGTVDYDSIPNAVRGAKVAYIQRSRGYSLRPSITVDEIERMVGLIKQGNPDAIIMVDNCYGELVEKREPTEVGADLIMGSLIKNPGGGIAQTGGYIAGRADLVELCAHRITAPGVGRDVGCSLGENKNMYMGFFFAPQVVASAVKTAVFAAEVMSRMGFEVTPKPEEIRTDIIQAVVLEHPNLLNAFCGGIQKGAPIDSFVTPIAGDMPGYDDPVIMAAGAFHMGASIELSADGPMRPPYAAWLQGGLTWDSGKLGVEFAADAILKTASTED